LYSLFLLRIASVRMIYVQLSRHEFATMRTWKPHYPKWTVLINKRNAYARYYCSHNPFEQRFTNFSQSKPLLRPHPF
jgi:hypothetical protein